MDSQALQFWGIWPSQLSSASERPSPSITRSEVKDRQVGAGFFENIPVLSRFNRNLPASSNRGTEVLQKYEIQTQITRMSALQKGWDSYSAEAPSPGALELAHKVLEASFSLGLLPLKAVPDADGGVALVLMVRPNYAALEIDNDGDILAVFSDRKNRHEVWETSSQDEELRRTSERLREFMYV